MRAIVAHVSEGCPATGPLSIQLEALGDFAASTLTSETAPGTANARALPFPESTRAVSARADGSGRWLGFGEAGQHTNIDFMLWPSQDACSLWPVSATPTYPFEAAGVALGFAPTDETLLIAGGLVASGDAARAVSVDLARGESSEVPDGMPAFRAFSSITAFGTHALLVAGGIDPTLGEGNPADGAPTSTALTFDTATRRFTKNEPVHLIQPRARHAAVVLANGDTLLIGGSGPNGVPLATLEAISPATHGARAAGLATLGQARMDPIAFRLDDDRIFVGGGSDTNGVVSRLEWLSADASSVALFYDKVGIAPHHAFAPMPGGSVLGVGVCTTPPCLEKNAMWFVPDGLPPRKLPDLSIDPTAVQALRLVAGTDGAPWLYVLAGSRLWRRFDPWTGLFDEPDDAPSSGPDADLVGPTSVGPGVFAWIERDGGQGRLKGFRYDTRSAWAQDVAPLLLAGREHVVPNQPPVGAPGLGYTASGLALQGTGALAQIADATYAGLEAQLTMSSGAAPVLVLGTTRLGGATCPWPTSGDTTPGELLTLTRSGESAVLSRGGSQRKCAVPAGRLPLGLSAESAVSVVRSLRVLRR